MTMHILQSLLARVHHEVTNKHTPRTAESNPVYAHRLAILTAESFGLKVGELATMTETFAHPEDASREIRRTALVIGTRYGSAFVFQKGFKGGGVGYVVPKQLWPMIAGLEDTSSAKLDLVAGRLNYSFSKKRGVPNIGQRTEELLADVVWATRRH